MIELNAPAANKIKELLADKPGMHVRFFVEKGGCSGQEYGMKIDEKQPNDLEFSSLDVVLIVDPESHEKLKGMVVEFDDSLNGKGFMFKNPNASSTCGCGKSFS